MKRVLGCIRRADERYRMIHPGDKICVGVSGGKDSLLLLYGLKLYQKFCHTPFELIGVMLDLGISDQNYQPVADFAESIGVLCSISAKSPTPAPCAPSSAAAR